VMNHCEISDYFKISDKYMCVLSLVLFGSMLMNIN
jgi:hypothetical protein